MGCPRKGKAQRRSSDLLFPQRIVPCVPFDRVCEESEGKPHESGAARIQEAGSRPREDVRQRQAVMKTRNECKKRSDAGGTGVGQEVIASLKEAIAWAGGE